MSIASCLILESSSCKHPRDYVRCVYVATYSCNVQNLVLKAFKRKMRDIAEACRSQGLTFLPAAMETLGGLHSTAVGQVKKLGAALARKKGCDEREPTSQLFSRLCNPHEGKCSYAFQ